MTVSTALFLLLRVAHVLLAAIWVGVTVFLSFLLIPALEDAGAAAGPVMSALMRRKLHVFMASLGGTTVLTGFYLYYRFTGGFDPTISGSIGAMVYGTGGIAGTIALIIGGSIVAGSAKKMTALGERLASAPEGERAALVAQIAAARQRAATFSRVVVVLQAIALICMAVGHYV